MHGIILTLGLYVNEKGRHSHRNQVANRRITIQNQLYMITRECAVDT